VIAEPSGGPDDNGRKGNFIGAIIVIVQVVAVAWLAHVLYKNLQMEKCEAEGRHDCSDLPQPDQ
jgi:hypothetical protein